jgi:hypothetical protein
MFEPMHRRPARGGDEVDAFSSNHKLHGYNHGDRAKIKTRQRRRVRRLVRQVLATGTS